jgi:drug/metabolite transporter (DMT)-like permease
LKPYILLLVGVLSVSFAAIFIRIAEAPPPVIAASRLVLAATLIVPLAAAKKHLNFKALTRRDFAFIAFSSLFLALHFALWITSLDYTSIASSVVLVTAHPAFVAVLSYLLWAESIGKFAKLGIAVAIAGVVIINYGQFSFESEALLGNVMALAAGLAAGAYLLIGRQVRERVNIWNYLALVYSGAGILLLFFALAAGYGFTGYSSTTYLMFLLLALVPQLIGHTAINMAVRLIPATIVSTSILGEPIGAIILGIFILGEYPVLNEILGATVILFGIFLVIRYGSQKKAAVKTAEL